MLLSLFVWKQLYPSHGYMLVYSHPGPPNEGLCAALLMCDEGNILSLFQMLINQKTDRIRCQRGEKHQENEENFCAATVHGLCCKLWHSNNARQQKMCSVLYFALTWLKDNGPMDRPFQHQMCMHITGQGCAIHHIQWAVRSSSHSRRFSVHTLLQLHGNTRLNLLVHVPFWADYILNTFESVHSLKQVFLHSRVSGYLLFSYCTFSFLFDSVFLHNFSQTTNGILKLKHKMTRALLWINLKKKDIHVPQLFET